MSALSTDDTAALGAALRRAREAAGFSRDRLAVVVGLSSSRIQHYEKGFHKVYGHKHPDVVPSPMLALIATTLGTTAADVLSDAGLPATALPSIPPRGVTEAAVAEKIDQAERISVKIDSPKETWEAFVRTLEGEAKDRFVQLLVAGTVQATAR